PGRVHITAAGRAVAGPHPVLHDGRRTDIFAVAAGVGALHLHPPRPAAAGVHFTVQLVAGLGAGGFAPADADRLGAAPGRGLDAGADVGRRAGGGVVAHAPVALAPGAVLLDALVVMAGAHTIVVRVVAAHRDGAGGVVAGVGEGAGDAAKATGEGFLQLVVSDRAAGRAPTQRHAAGGGAGR